MLALSELFSLRLDLSVSFEWGNEQHHQLLSLYERSCLLQRETVEVEEVFNFGKPVLDTDDSIEIMLMTEDYRMDFEKNNVLYLEMKNKENKLKEDIRSFALENPLFRDFITKERSETLCGEEAIFNRYGTILDVERRLNILSDATAYKNSSSHKDSGTHSV